MSHQEERFEPAPHVTCTSLDESEAILLDLETKYFYTLNQTGLFIWDLLQKGGSLIDIAGSLEAAYAIDRQEALDRVRRFIDTLKRENLIQEVADF